MSSTKKPTLYLIHGLRGSHAGLTTLETLLSPDFTIINHDLPGTGSTPALKPACLDSYIEYLHKTISRLPEKPVIIAHSMGSIIASRYIAKYPNDTAEKCILLSPIFRTRPGSAANTSLYYLMNSVLLPLPPKTKKRFLKSKPVSYLVSHYLTYDKSKQKEIDQYHFNYCGFDSSKSLLADMKISMTNTAIIPPGKQTLVIVGAKDRLVNAKKTKKFVQSLNDFPNKPSKNPQSSPINPEKIVQTLNDFEQIENTGHLINYERPELIASRILSFLTPK